MTGTYTRVNIRKRVHNLDRENEVLDSRQELLIRRVTPVGFSRICLPRVPHERSNERC